MTIKLEVGKTYELNDGSVHVCDYMYGCDQFSVNAAGYGPFQINGTLYHRNGVFGAGGAPSFNVKREVVTEDDSPKLEDESPILWKDMTPEEKGTLLLAHHEGKTIEVFEVSRGSWVKPINTIFYDWNAYRIKPEVKRETVALYGNPSGSSTWGRVQMSWDTHKITFDLIDGTPDLGTIHMEEI